jgi:23S rRNA (guanosine2251-2'-O)-methyltransferase
MQKSLQSVSCVVLSNIRSCHNVGSVLRTAEFFGVKKVYALWELLPTLLSKLGDDRLPHIAQKLDKQIQKVSLGAEGNLELEHFDTLDDLIVLNLNPKAL